jgi:hypothetical protein
MALASSSGVILATEVWKNNRVNGLTQLPLLLLESPYSSYVAQHGHILIFDEERNDS